MGGLPKLFLGSYPRIEHYQKGDALKENIKNMVTETELGKGTPEPVVVSVETPTPEQQLKSLETELTKYKALADEKEKGFKTLQVQLGEEQGKLRKQAGIEERIQDLSDQMKILAAYVATSAGGNEDELTETPKEKKNALLQKFDQLEKERKEKTDKVQLTETVATYQKRTEDLGLSQTDESYWEIHDLVTEGKFQRADIKLKKLEQAKTKPTETPKQVDIDKEIEERARKILEERGLLVAETGSPSASASSSGEAMAQYARGEITEAEAKKKGAKFS